MNWSKPTDSGSTENARLENRKHFKILFKLLYLRFSPLQIRTCVFCTCIFHPCTFVLTYSVLAYSILRYFRFPYLRFQSPRCSNRSITPASRAHSSKPAAAGLLLWVYAGTDRRTDTVPFHRPAPHAMQAVPTIFST